MSGISSMTTPMNSTHRRSFFDSSKNNSSNEENASVLQVQSWMTMSPPSGTIVSNSIGIHDEKEQPLGLQRQLSLSSTTLQQKQKELATFLPCRGSLLYCSPPRKALVDDGQNKEEGHHETVVSGNKSATTAGVMATADGAVHEVHNSAAGPTLLKEAMSGAVMAGTTDCSKGKDEHCNSKKTQISWLLSHCNSSSSSSKKNNIIQERSVLSATDQDDIDYLISLSMFESLISTTNTKTISINEEEKEESRATATSGSSTTQHVDSSSSSTKTSSPVCIRDIPSLYFPTLPEDLDEAVNDIATSMSIHQDSMMF